MAGDVFLITGPTNDEHFTSLREVLSQMQKAGLRLEKAKCKFFQEKIEFLGSKSMQKAFILLLQSWKPSDLPLHLGTFRS